MASRPSFDMFPARSGRCAIFCVLAAAPLVVKCASAATGSDETHVEFGRAVVPSPSRHRKQIEDVDGHGSDELRFFDFSPRTQRDALLRYDESNDFLEEFFSLSLSYSYDYMTEVPPREPSSKSPTAQPTSSPTSRMDSNDEDQADMTPDGSTAAGGLAPVSSSQSGKTPVPVFSCSEEGGIKVEDKYTPDAKNFTAITSVTIAFTYSADTSRNDTSFVASLDRAVLFTAVSAALDCASPPSGRQLSDNKVNKEDRALMELNSLPDNSSTASHAAGSCKPTAPSAQFCFLMQRRLTFLLSGVSDPEHADTRALINIETAMKDGRYVTGHIPSLQSVHFLGSQPGSFENEPRSSAASPATGVSLEQAQDDTFSLLAKGALAFISVGGIVLALFFVHKRRNRRSVQHVELKDDNLSMLTPEGYGQLV